MSHLADNVESMMGWENKRAAAPVRAACVTAAAIALRLTAVIGEAQAETMVRYALPVVKKGNRVLYHGAWRDGGHAKA